MKSSLKICSKCHQQRIIRLTKTINGVRYPLCESCLGVYDKEQKTIKDKEKEKKKATAAKVKKANKLEAKRHSKESICKLIQELARKLDGNTCCTCDKKFTSNNIAHGGHGVKAAKNILTAFMLKNVHAQCASCNMFLDGSQYNYGLFVNRKYGEGTFERIQGLSNKTYKIDLPKRKELRDKVLEWLKKADNQPLEVREKLRNEFIQWQEDWMLCFI